jgi:hypothetical protein
MNFEQYTDVILSPATLAGAAELVQDRDGNLYTGPAKLYIQPPGTAAGSVTPVDVTVTDGDWSYKQYCSLAGDWYAQIRATGETKGSSQRICFTIDASLYPAP